MTETQILFGILVLIYLSDCIVWINANGLLFHQGWAGAWSYTNSSLIGNSRGGVFVLNPLPWNAAYFVYWTPISISPFGICNFGIQCPRRSTRPVTTRDWLPFKDFTAAVADEKKLWINGYAFSRCGTAREAQQLAQLITRLCSLGEKERSAVIKKYITASLSYKKANKTYSIVRKVVAPLQRIASLFFGMVFIALPFVTVFFGLHTILWPLLLLTVVFVSLTAVAFYRADKVINPNGQFDRVSNMVKMLVCPPVAIRACDFSTLDSLAIFHPFVIADVLLVKKATNFHTDIVRDYLHPLPVNDAAPEAKEIADWFFSQSRKEAIHALRSKNPQLYEEIVKAPEWDKSSKAYCPRCQSQFTRADGECSDCVGINLIEMPKT